MSRSPSRPVRPRARVRRIAVTALLAGLAIVSWRWLPRAPVAATAEMLAAAEALVSARPAELPPPSPPSDPRTDRERLLARAFALRGIPYRYGAKGPHEYDCSGFTKAAYEGGGVALPDGSYNQASGEQPLDDPATLAPGDLIFYRWPSEEGVSHVTLYAGDGWVLGTGSPGQPPKVVLYPLSGDLVDDGRVLTYRHVVLADER